MEMKEKEFQKPEKWYGVRFTQIILLFFLAIILYGMRVSLSLGIVAMTDVNSQSSFPTYNWTDKSIVLSSFYWGYIVPQVAAGQIAETFGTKWLLTGTVTLASISTIIIPFVADYGSWAVMICRIIQGVSQSPAFPSIHVMLSTWAPTPELSRMTSFVYAGIQFGSGICNMIAGAMTESSWGWPSLFYLYGVAGFVWLILWLWLGASTPDDHKSISAEEKRYIKDTQQKKEYNESIPTPWLDIVTSLSFLSVAVAHFVQNWGYTTLLTELPSYMDYVLGFELSSNGLLSSLPYIAMGIMSFIFGAIFDYIINQKILHITTTRKLANGIGFVGPAISLFCLGAIDVTSTSAVSLLVVTLAVNAAINSGFQTSHVDLSPRFSGTLMGITNTCGALSAILGPLMVQFIVKDESSSHQWGIVFFVSAGVYLFGAVVFSVFASGERQPWNEGSQKTIKLNLRRKSSAPPKEAA